MQPSRAYFDEAEEAYKSGHYERASLLYKEFLKSNPDPQLARLAERRSLSIEREIDNVMGKKDAARPVYISPNASDEESTGATDSRIFILHHEERSY